MKVFLGFERQPVEQPAKRWVIVRDDQKDEAAPAGKRSESEPEPVAAVESQGQNPAA